METRLIEPSRLFTEFAPAERTTGEEIRRQHNILLAHAGLILDAVPGIVVILNEFRQIVLANSSLLTAIEADSVDQVLGMRPGEALGCIHSSSTGGCGTSRFCSQCGAVKTILAGLAGHKASEECRIRREIAGRTEALDLLVFSTPFEMAGENFTVFSVMDISHEKRRRALEHIFFHDILNTAGGVKGLMSLLKDEVPSHLRADVELIHASCNQLEEEIISQKELLAAESDDLKASPLNLRSSDALVMAARMSESGVEADGKTLVVAPGSADVFFESDFALLLRVLRNLIKNALEASSPGDIVTVACQADASGIEFSVHNPAVMPPEVQLQIFHRSFSTKGAGRGLGTYSIRLLTERYLKGQASFTSVEVEGTTFRIRLPWRLS